jgi:hypothetical protein
MQASLLFKGRALRTVVQALLGDEGLFAPEFLIPTALPDTAQTPSHRKPQWRFEDVDQLLADPQFARGLALFAIDKANVIRDAINDPNQQAFVQMGVVNPLVEAPIKTLYTSTQSSTGHLRTSRQSATLPSLATAP